MLNLELLPEPVASVKNLTKCIQEVGIDMDDLILESLASAEAVLTREEKQTGVLLANVGGGTTDIAVFKEGTLYHSSVLPVAGIQITADVAAGLGLTFKAAEEMKKKYGKISTSKDNEPDKALAADGREISYRDLCDVISMRVEEIMRLVMLMMPGADYAKVIPSGIVITGGSANIPGFVDMTRAVTHLPVRIGKPSPLKGVGGVVLEIRPMPPVLA